MTDRERKFISGVFYFWKEKEDPTRFVDWDEALCRDLMPGFYYAWCQYRMAVTVMNVMAATFVEDE